MSIFAKAQQYKKCSGPKGKMLKAIIQKEIE